MNAAPSRRPASEQPRGRPSKQCRAGSACFWGAAPRPTTREDVASGDADFTPVILSELAGLFGRELPIDVALVQATPPDAHGFCSLGVSIDIVKPAIEHARVVIAEINPHMPRTHGDAFVHVSRFAH